MNKLKYDIKFKLIALNGNYKKNRNRYWKFFLRYKWLIWKTNWACNYHILKRHLTILWKYVRKYIRTLNFISSWVKVQEIQVELRKYKNPENAKKFIYRMAKIYPHLFRIVK